MSRTQPAFATLLIHDANHFASWELRSSQMFAVTAEASRLCGEHRANLANRFWCGRTVTARTARMLDMLRCTANLEVTALTASRSRCTLMQCVGWCQTIELRPPCRLCEMQDSFFRAPPRSVGCFHLHPRAAN